MKYKLLIDIGDKKAGDIIAPSDQFWKQVALKLMLEKGWIEEVKEWPQAGDKYWFVTDSGGITFDYWGDSDFDYKTKNFLGVFRTREEAEARLQEIREKIK